jgi:hypothetical protein
MVNAAILSVALALAAATEAGALPEEARLGAEAAPLRTLVDRAAEGGLPSELLVSKIREGLAKNVDPSQIRAATERLLEALDRARGFIGERRPGPPARDLLQAVAQAQLAGCGFAELDRLLSTASAPGPTARAIDVLVDLMLRGYPSAPASRMVRVVLVQEPEVLGRLPAILERLRQDQALSQRDVVAMLARTRGGVAGWSAELQRQQASERSGGPGGGRLLPANELRGPRNLTAQARSRSR